MKYIKNTIEYGVKFDWKKIRAAMHVLGIPADVHNPEFLPLEAAKLFVCCSERNIGKTTNWLLLGMCMNDLYGTVIQYVRQREDMIAPKALKNLFDTILLYDYVSKVTHGRWNSVVYNSRRYYYCNVDETGQIIEKAEQHFMFVCSVEAGEMLKSSYNAPLGDLIIFDEFIGRMYYPNEFVQFMDLCKTIIRGRRSPIIAMLANTINPHSPYYNELCIKDEIEKMNQGDSKIITTQAGTRVYVEIVGATAEKKEKNSVINRLFFGFKNPLLGAITGESTWSMKQYQHIPELDEGAEETVQVISRQLYVYYSGKYVRLDIVLHSTLGQCIYCHWSGVPKKSDAIILTAEYRTDARYMYRYGSGLIEKYFKKMLAENRIYYATNDVGCFLESYLDYIKMLKI